MTLDDFKCEVAIWGPDIGRWPAVRQPEARAMAEMPEARAVLAAAAAFETRFACAFAEVSQRRADDAAFCVLSRIAREHAVPRTVIAEAISRWLMPLGGMAMSAALGVAAAHMVNQSTASHGGTVLVSQILDSGSLAADLAVQ